MSRPLMKWPLAEAVDLYRAGWSYTQLGKKYGVRGDNIMRAFKLRGFASRPQGQPRKSVCHRGHEMSGENIYVHQKSGHRQCRACRRQRYLQTRAA